MKVYITKWALVADIVVMHARSRIGPKTKRINASEDATTPYPDLFSYREWYQTWAEAVVRAKQMRDAEIDRLQRALDTMKALTFPATEPEEKA